MINASEIADFVYCERSWWLAKHNYFGELDPRHVTASFKPGTEYHQTYSNTVQSVFSQRRNIRWLMIIVALVALAAIVLLFLGQAHGSAPKHKAHSPANSTSSSSSSQVREVPLIDRARGALIFCIYILPILLFIIFLLRRSAGRKQKRWQMPHGRLIYADNEDAPALVCHELGLAGKPDAVWSDGTCCVPEERKSREMESRRGPFENHIVQLAAYCYLVTKHYGPVQKGLISYSNIQHEVSYNHAHYERLVSMLSRMRMLEGVSEVHRSHRSIAKCRACVAASICREALHSS